ncbi:MAG: tyrosine-type recombinase/integrase, partial [Verrucomicrobiota bacterium]
DVDTKDRTIFLQRPKGGTRRAFSIPYDDSLAPLLEKLKEERGATWAFDWPKNLPSKDWFLFFGRLSAKHGLPRYSFHCLRVTFITRGVKAGVPEAVMMKLVNHAGTTVHRAYQRLTFEDARPYLAKLRPKIPTQI